MDRLAIELAVVVPTFNESENAPELVRRLRACLSGISWEVIFVDDDSPDGTADCVRRLAREDHRVRCLQRIGRRGLSSACVEGMLSTSAPYMAVIDGDLQHDETLLPDMLKSLKSEDVDIVIGSRYIDGGSVGVWDTGRVRTSRFATALSRLIVRADLSDPMSGFFMMRRGVLEGAVRHLSAVGFKILVDLFASSPGPLRFKELPYQFRRRHAGESKLDGHAISDYGMLLVDKLIGNVVPVRFVAFAAVGGVGVLLHLLTVGLLFQFTGTSFVVSQAVATLVAMTSNFALNNVITYRDRRLRGWRWLGGLLSFCSACAMGAVANIGIAGYLFSQERGWISAALCGVLVGAVWNYAVTSVYTWRRPRGA